MEQDAMLGYYGAWAAGCAMRYPEFRIGREWMKGPFDV